MNSYQDKIKTSFAKLCSANSIPTDEILSAILSPREDGEGNNVIITLDTSKLVSGDIRDLWIQVPTLQMDLKKAGIRNIKTDWLYAKSIKGQIVPVTDSKEITDRLSRDGNKVHLLPKLTVTLPDSLDSALKIEKANQYIAERSVGDNLMKYLNRPQSGSGWNKT